MYSSLAVLGAMVGTKAGEWTGHMQRMGQVESDTAKVSGLCSVSQISKACYTAADTICSEDKVGMTKKLVTW